MNLSPERFVHLPIPSELVILQIYFSFSFKDLNYLLEPPLVPLLLPELIPLLLEPLLIFEPEDLILGLDGVVVRIFEFCLILLLERILELEF